MTSVDTFTAPLGSARAADVCDEVLRRSDADQTEVAVLARRGEHTRFAGGRIHQPQDLTECSVWVRVVVGGGTGRAMTSDLHDVGAAVGRALAAARTDRGPVVDVNASAEPATSVPSLWDDEVGGFDARARSELAHRAMTSGRAVNTEMAGMVGRAVTEMAVATSAGRRRYAAATEVHASITATCDDGSSHWSDLDRRLATIDAETAVGETVDNARRMRGRQPLTAGTYDVVLGPIAVGGLLEGFRAFGFTGASVADGTGAVAARAGMEVAAPAVTLRDDGSYERGLPIPFDVEGTDKRPVAFLTDGRVGEAVTDLATAARLGATSTGHAHIAREEPPAAVPANLVLRPGSASVSDLVAGVEDGVYVERFWYLRPVDPTNTTVTGVARDALWRIERGRLTTPLTGARWTESVFGVLSRVDGISADVMAQPLSNIWNGAITTPAVRVRGFRFGPAVPATSRS